MYSWVPLTISQIKDAANQLVASVSVRGSASVVVQVSESFEAKSPGLAARATIAKKPEEKA
jgi:hypothetical protein